MEIASELLTFTGKQTNKPTLAITLPPTNQTSWFLVGWCSLRLRYVLVKF